MRRIRLILMVALGAALAIVGVANMTPVDLRLLPAFLSGERFVMRGIPLAFVVLGAVLAGIVAGQVIEYFRERRYRRLLEEKRAEVAELRHELERLRAELGDRYDDLPRIPA